MTESIRHFYLLPLQHDPSGCIVVEKIKGAIMDNTSRPVYRIMDLHESDRPRERLASLGPQALTNAELLAILLRVGVKGENAVEVGQRLLNKFGGLTGLHRAPFIDLKKQHGLVTPKPHKSKPLLNWAEG